MSGYASSEIVSPQMFPILMLSVRALTSTDTVDIWLVQQRLEAVHRASGELREDWQRLARAHARRSDLATRTI